MFAIAFDLVVKDTQENHPKSVQQAYVDIGATLAEFGFIERSNSPLFQRGAFVLCQANIL